LYIHTQSVDTTTPAGRAMFGMLGIFSEFEREMIVARVNAGLARARDTIASSARRAISASASDVQTPIQPDCIVVRRLGALGWIEGQTIVIDCVSAVGGIDQVRHSPANSYRGVRMF
jgi:DNA invertase Pin-like site-specific DNA recombinase